MQIEKNSGTNYDIPKTSDYDDKMELIGLLI